MSVKVLLASLLFLYKVFLSHELAILQGPQNISVSESDEVILDCKFDGPAKGCMWAKDGEITTILEPYQYVGSPENGDCSIRITKIDLARDDGLWQCQNPRFGSNPAVLSQYAKVTVLVPPQDPSLSINGQTIEIGGTLSIENASDNITLYCVSKNGNPATQLYWMIDNERRDGFIKNETVVNNGSLRLYNTESQLQLDNGPHLRGTQIKCVAEHPTYKGRLHESYGYLQVHHNTTQVQASVEGPYLTNVAVNPNDRVTLYCIADGIPTPNYSWSFQRSGEDRWEDIGNQQNLTIEAKNGKFFCKAGNDYNIEYIKSFEEIQVEIKAENKVTAQNGAFSIYLSVTLLVLTAAANGIALFIY